MANELPLIGLQAGAGTFTNASGGDLLAGALVVRDPTTDSNFKTTTSLGDVAVLGVLVDAIADGNSGRVLLDGVITMDVSGSVGRGQFLKTSTLAGAAIATSTYGLGVFGVALDVSAGGQVKALVFRVERSSGATPHDIFADHDVALSVSDAGGLTVDYEGGQLWAGGTFYVISSGSIGVTNNDTTYVFVNSSGVVAVSTVGFPVDSTPLAVVVASGGSITSVDDRRSYLSTSAMVDQIIDDDGDTSVEVERGADDDTIRLKAATVDVALITSAGQWQLPVIGPGAGIRMGGDTLLYRAAADLLALAAGDSLDLVQGYIQLEDMTTPTTPDFGDMKFFVRVAGGNIQLIGKGPTGEECVICDVSNTLSAPNTLARNWIG